ncbi:aromatic-L-amino-acid decarboxylase-like [Copidosoma floridanum]|uniref:aromatic-L-amino-acid decarboxylase-like n=1 Tax=Copidosoma floridanum TaxID=29053 RepID=UPI0006C93C1E|nr:aromatic-L-amino-acid decarboxylase-like [Copidosoma floridanum]
MNIDEFRVHGKEMVEYICNYIRTLEGKRVTANVDPGYLRPLLPDEAPLKPESFDAIMRDVEGKIMPGITHWQHPRFHAYFPSGNSFPSILGDMLSDAIGCIGFSWAASPACTELESIVLDWYAKAIGLPEAFLSSPKQDIGSGGGVIQGSASECVLVTMLAARAQAIRALQEQEGPGEDSGFLPRLVAYCSTEAHSCVEKAAMICLVKLRVLQPDEACRLRGPVLEAAMVEDLERGLSPFFVSTSLGTTGCCAFDELREIGPVCRRFPGVWLHVDAAYAGSSFICPEQRPLMAGIEYADSFNTNPNKWLLVSFDCSCLWVRDRLKLTSALAVDPLYLQHANSAESIDYRHWGIPLSRRFRALKLWFVMRSYGLVGLQAYIRNHIKLAQRFETRLRRDRRFELLNEARAGLVCFRLREPAGGGGSRGDELNQELLASINASGCLHMIPARVRGRYALRFCVVHEHATEREVDWALECIREHASELLLMADTPVEDELKQALAAAKSPKSPKQLDRKLVRKFSFTRAVSRDAYRRSRSKTSLHDGATPIMVLEDSSKAIDTIDEDEDSVFCDSR